MAMQVQSVLEFIFFVQNLLLYGVVAEIPEVISSGGNERW